jgi:DNA (cytosine-5)-methyltransferase 1
MLRTLVLSLFPGIGMLDAAFEAEGFCVVRGPDVLWGGDIRRFHPPAGRFDGVIGGPPCQAFSVMRRLLKASGRDTKGIDLVPEFSRCVDEALPQWFVMENVKDATPPSPQRDYQTDAYDVRDSDVGGQTRRRRRFWFGSRLGKRLVVVPRCRDSILPVERAVTRNARIVDESHIAKAKLRGGGPLPGDGRYMKLHDVCELQGLPRTYFDGSPFKVADIRVMLGNGVPMAMGRAIAKAVARHVAPSPGQAEKGT